MRAPRYGERSLAEVLPSVAAALGVSGERNALALPACDQAVVVVVDGLGHLQLEQAGHAAPFLTSHLWEPVDAAFPTTTPCGIASLALGLTPGMHGMVGATFRVPDFDVVLNPLHWESEPPPAAVQPEPNVFARLAGVDVRTHGPAAFATSGMTRTLLANATAMAYVPPFTPAAIAPAVGRLDYVYLPELDKLGHGLGPNTPDWERCLRWIDGVVSQISRALPPDALIMVTSDHGMVAVPDERRINADDPLLQAGVERMAGEPRMRHLYCSDPVTVQARWAREIGDRGYVLTRDEAVALGLFGAADDVLLDRVGDVIAIAADDWAFVSQAVDPKPSGLRGLHGALTDAELLVPLVVARGAA